KKGTGLGDAAMVGAATRRVATNGSPATPAICSFLDICASVSDLSTSSASTQSIQAGATRGNIWYSPDVGGHLLLGSSRVDQAVAHGIESRRATRRGPDLVVDVLDGAAGGSRRYRESSSDLLVGKPACDEREDFGLAGRQATGQARLAARPVAGCGQDRLHGGSIESACAALPGEQVGRLWSGQRPSVGAFFPESLVDLSRSHDKRRWWDGRA